MSCRYQKHFRVSLAGNVGIGCGFGVWNLPVLENRVGLRLKIRHCRVRCQILEWSSGVFLQRFRRCWSLSLSRPNRSVFSWISQTVRFLWTLWHRGYFRSSVWLFFRSGKKNKAWRICWVTDWTIISFINRLLITINNRLQSINRPLLLSNCLYDGLFD